MRNINFEAKRLDNREWIQGDLCNGIHKSGQCIMPNAFFATRDFPDGDEDEEDYGVIQDYMAIGGFYPVDPETVGQSCDYYDDEGEEVFENDTMRVTHFGEQYDGHVYWSDRELMFKLKTTEGRSFALASISSGIVTGNIHDHETA